MRDPHRPRIVTLLTDFGNDGPYVGELKGALLRHCDHGYPMFVDITHNIMPQDIAHGAWVLGATHRGFPAGTVHLAIVDPGVGTARRMIALKNTSSHQWYLGPDNGIFTHVLSPRDGVGLVASQWLALGLNVPEPASATFHGRDVVAPAAAQLLNSDSLGLGGAPISVDQLTRLAMHPRALTDPGAPRRCVGYSGRVIYADRFGNLTTNIHQSDLMEILPVSDTSMTRVYAHPWTITYQGRSCRGVVRTYGAAPVGTLQALIGSSGWLELAVVNGSASQLFRWAELRENQHEGSSKRNCNEVSVFL